MKSFVELSRILLLECGRQLGVDTKRDIHTLVTRHAKEGDSFITIALPAFCQSLERALDRGHVVNDDWSGPSWAKSSPGYPRFLGGFLNLVFDARGYLRPDVDPDVVYLLRQFLLVRKKVWAIASEKRQSAALSGYIECEKEIVDDVDCEIFRRVSAIVLTSILAQDRYGFCPSRIKGQHGPGATAEGLTTNGRWNFRTWSERLERVFPHGYHAFPTEYHYYSDTDVSTTLLSENDELPVKVVFVPKTMKTPRVIAIEPAYNQYIQQGIMRWLVPLIERSSITGGRVNFTDQTVNQRLALESSVTGRLSTIDMKEASDRVSVSHVERMFAMHPQLLDAIMACRSTRAKLPDGRVVVLRKFASMGSALCFPVEALAFFIAIVSARIVARGVSADVNSVRKYARDVYVFGDDLLVPKDETPGIIGYLEAIGFKVNRHKSFWNGKFRESCGVDAYNGQEITPVYVRFDLDPSVVESVVSWVASANQMYHKGMWSTARWMRAQVENHLGPLPFGTEASRLLSWRNFSNSSTHRRWNKLLHRFEERGFITSTRRRRDPLNGVSALHKCLRLIGVESPQADHLATTDRPWSLRLKARWAPAN